MSRNHANCSKILNSGTTVTSSPVPESIPTLLPTLLTPASFGSVENSSKFSPNVSTVIPFDNNNNTYDANNMNDDNIEYIMI